MLNHPLPRIDKDEKLRKLLLPYCRFKNGTVWNDDLNRHKSLVLMLKIKLQLKMFLEKLKLNSQFRIHLITLLPLRKKKVRNLFSGVKIGFRLMLKSQKKILLFIFGLVLTRRIILNRLQNSF